MPVLTVNGTEYSVPAGIRLSDALARANVSTSWPCGGLGRCGKCRVKARGALSEPDVQERQLLSAEELAAGVRLACRTYVLGDCKAEAAVSSGEEIATRGAGRVAAVRPAFSRYGAAVDLGTTTLAARIYDASGRLLASGGRMNPQSRFGADVISRIQASMDGARGELAACVREGIAALLAELCEKAGLSPAELDGAVIAGNTAMLYLLTASAPDALSRAPFEADRLFGEETDAAALALPLGEGARVYLPRCISAFVGADITAAITSSGLCRSDKTQLLADVGTNGEMALWHGGKLRCCSTAAGPAFEGAGLSMGMQGADGAIDHRTVEDGELCAHVIGGKDAKGVCGSGVVDALACLLDLEALDETGLLDGDPTPLSGDVSLTQKDVRMIQLAKSAVCAGMYTLVERASLTTDDVSELLVAGGFGSYLDLGSAGKIGLIPLSIVPRTRVIGNASLDGASMLLLDKALRAESEAMANAAETVDLSTDPVFMEQYTEGMFF